MFTIVSFPDPLYFHYRWTGRRRVWERDYVYLYIAMYMFKTMSARLMVDFFLSVPVQPVDYLYLSHNYYEFTTQKDWTALLVVRDIQWTWNSPSLP